MFALGSARSAIALENNDNETATARLEVQARSRCATRDDVVARVAARSQRIRLVTDADARPSMRVIISPASGHRVVAELLTLRAGGQMSSRRVSAASCAQAVDAIALIIALTLDPTHVAVDPNAAAGSTAQGASANSAKKTPSANETGGSSSPASQANEPATSVAGATPVNQQREPATAEAVESPAPIARDSDVDAVPAAKVATAAASRESPNTIAMHRRFSMGVAGEVVSGPAPSLLGGGALYAMAMLDRDALWSPAVVIWGSHSRAKSVVEPSGTASFVLTSVSLDACPLRLAFEVVEARLCATATVGRLAASGSHTYSPASESRPYAALGGATLVSVGIGRLFVVTGRVAAGTALVRDAFSFAPNVFYRSAALTVSSDLALGVRFP